MKLQERGLIRANWAVALTKGFPSGVDLTCSLFEHKRKYWYVLIKDAPKPTIIHTYKDIIVRFYKPFCGKVIAHKMVSFNDYVFNSNLKYICKHCGKKFSESEYLVEIRRQKLKQI